MREILEVVARPKGVYSGFMDNDLVSLTQPQIAHDAFGAAFEVANLPDTCRGQYTCIADYLLRRPRSRWEQAYTPQQRRGFVYFIGPDNGPVKIGTTECVRTRLVALQTGSPLILKVWAVVPGGMELERGYQKCFANHRLHGEWFERGPLIESEIRYWRVKARRHREVNA